MKTKLTASQNVQVLNMLKHVMTIMSQKCQEQGLNNRSYSTVEDGFEVNYNFHHELDNWIIAMDLKYSGEKIGSYTGSITDLDDRYIHHHATALMNAWGFQLARPWKLTILTGMKILKAVELGMGLTIVGNNSKWNVSKEGSNESGDELAITIMVERINNLFKISLDIPDLKECTVAGTIGLVASTDISKVTTLVSSLVELLEEKLRSHYN